jgi:serine/threonine protein phosphatase PrpC
MASRLQIKYGLVAEEDRLASSSDALIVTEPTTGSKARSKGSLYLIATSRHTGGRTREACRLVADSIRREYYYDESAGIAIVLEKAIRASNRRLRHSREGAGLPMGAIGVALAVVRGGELYVATCGDADGYLVRSARLLMPEHDSGSGLPAADSLKVDVWRGEFSVGDSLVLCSRNVVETVGTEELKNAVVTLHPQSAAEHLHHLFVAAGGDGSDAVLAIEATEVSLSRVEHRLVPVSPSEPLAGAPITSPIPLADKVAGAATAVQERAVAARGALREGFSGGLNRVLDVMPRRRTSFRRITSTTSQRETQRRAALAILAAIGLVAVLGVGLWYWRPLRSDSPIDQVNQGEAALADAIDSANKVFGPDDLIHTDPDQAKTLLRDAWSNLAVARAAKVDSATIAQLDAELRSGLDTIYATTPVGATQIYTAPAGARISALTQGPDDAAYAIVGNTVVRADPTTGAVTTVITQGDGAGVGVGAPRLLARGGPDLLVVDVDGGLWRWRPSGALGQVRLSGDQVWDDSVVNIECFVINPDQGLYRIYVPYPKTSQILRYDPTADGGGFSAPAPYFISESVDVSAFRQLYVDGDVYAVTADNLEQFFSGRQTAFTLDPPPDDLDLRAGHEYGRLAATGVRGDGNLYVWDKLWSRVLVYDKGAGAYQAQYLAAEGTQALTDITGMYVIDRGHTQAPLMIFATSTGLFQVELGGATGPLPSASPSPAASATTPPLASATPVATGPTPTPSPEPTATPRPRRTPRPVESPTAAP